MFKYLVNKLKLPTAGFGLDEVETTAERRNIICKKIFLRKLYSEWYGSILKSLPVGLNGKVLEIGSGAGFIKEVNDRVITSDVLPLEHCDMVISAEKLPFNDEELAAIIMVDVFHHIPDCFSFLSEAQRTLKEGGKIIMIEPANTWFGRFIYKNLHHEPFDITTDSWSFPSSGPLSGANIALPWIVFNRDLEKFKNEFKKFEQVKIHYHTPIKYLISGGFSFKSFAPGWAFGIVTFLEFLISPFSRYLAMFHTIEVIRDGN